MTRPRNPFGPIKLPPGKPIVCCPTCGEDVGLCEHTKGDLPHGFELKIRGTDTSVYVDKMQDGMFEIGEVKPEPMKRPPASGILFAEQKLNKLDIRDVFRNGATPPIKPIPYKVTKMSKEEVAELMASLPGL